MSNQFYIVYSAIFMIWCSIWFAYNFWHNTSSAIIHFICFVVFAFSFIVHINREENNSRYILKNYYKEDN